MKVSFSDRVEVPKHVLVCPLEKELVLLNLEAEFYFGLDEIGTRMWQALTTTESIDEAYAILSIEFEVGTERLRQDLLGVARETDREGFVANPFTQDGIGSGKLLEQLHSAFHAAASNEVRAPSVREKRIIGTTGPGIQSVTV